MNNWLLANLSPEQQQPFNRSCPNASVLAAAGSGKTRTLVHLLAADLFSGISAEQIIAFTFTEKAADELLARVHTLVRRHMPDIDLNGMYVGTIHAWCLQYLIEQSDYYGYTPLDELHVDTLASRLYDSLGLAETYGQPYPRALPKFLADLEIFYNECLTLSEVPEAIRGSLGNFLNVLRSNRLITFGDMIRYAIQHLQSNGPVRNLRALYVDEYQDVNPAQVALIKAMLPEEGRVVVVGDDLQCIYNWRGSDVTRILDFPNEFEDVSVHRLSTNYRARPPLVHLGNQIAQNISLRDQMKVMQPGRENVEFPLIHWISTPTEDDQVAAVVDIVRNLVAAEVPSNKIAVLLRSVRSYGRRFVDALTAAGLPVQCPILSRGGRFIEDFLLPIFEWLSTEHVEPRNERDEHQAEADADRLWKLAEPWVQAPDPENTFWDSLNSWFDLISANKNEAYDVRGQLYNFLDACHVRIAPDDSSLMVGMGIATQIVRSVEEIHRRRLAGHARRSARGVMSEAFYGLSRYHQDFGESIPIDTSQDGVLVSTVHQAKGLEWPVVILPMLVQNRFPVRNSSHGTSFPDEIAGRYGTTTDDERRLFYVAVTRARERLFLLDPLLENIEKRSVFLWELEKGSFITPTKVAEVPDEVWDLSSKDLEGGDTPPIRIGLSDLLIYLECPYQYGLRRVAAIQPSIGDELGFGEGLHELIQRRFESDLPWSSGDTDSQVNKFVNLPYMSQEGERHSRGAIKKRLMSLEALGVFSTEVESEVSVEVVLNGGIVHGVIDLIQINPDTSIRIRDWKANIHDAFIPRYERQLQFYSYALREQGRNVQIADLVDVAASSESGYLVNRIVNIEETVVSSLIHSFENALRGISGGEFEPRPNMAVCTSCDMRRICSQQRIG